MKIGILGAGGVGGYYGARLVHAGHDVTFVARGEHADALQKTGLHVRSELGDLNPERVRVVSDGEGAGPVDLLLVAVKLWDTESALQGSLRMVGEETVVVSLQNGVEKDEILRGMIGPERLLGGVTYIIAERTAPGEILHSGRLQRIILGEMDGTESSRVRNAVTALVEAGIDASASTDIRTETWKKFIFLSSVSALTAATRRTIGDLRANSVMRNTLHDAFHEATGLAQAEGVGISHVFAHDCLALADTLPPQGRSSMAQDLFRGRRLELEWLSGAIVRRASRVGLSVPTHERLYKQLLPYIDGTSDRTMIPDPIG